MCKGVIGKAMGSSVNEVLRSPCETCDPPRLVFARPGSITPQYPVTWHAANVPLTTDESVNSWRIPAPERGSTAFSLVVYRDFGEISRKKRSLNRYRKIEFVLNRRSAGLENACTEHRIPSVHDQRVSRCDGREAVKMYRRRSPVHCEQPVLKSDDVFEKRGRQVR